ncbi:MAG TPA: anthranilate phosphoribosyltransferase [Gammaproteobacteria bacterium]|nr:anthranilate phosphoribosyltransferase [Gammaproteobacteria bacterium]
MDMQQAIRAVTEGRNLSTEEMGAVMRGIMTGQATQAQIGGFLIGLRMKGETVDEIAAAAAVMRELATGVRLASLEHVVDTCGTGGDSSRIFNVSTATAFVVAGAGGRVAKHGNRSVSSQSGSADVLEAAGVRLDLSPEQVAACIETVGVGFLFAPLYHGAMRHAVGPRREMGVRTVFNVLGPLTNPAGAPNQLLGVFSEAWVEPLAQVLCKLGSRHVMAVHSADGLDELSIAAPAAVAELRDGRVHRYTLDPRELGLAHPDIEALRVRDAEESLAMIRRVFEGETGAARDMVLLNSGAAVYVAGLAESLDNGIDRACEAIDGGAAARRLDHLVRFTRALEESQA